MFATPTVDKSLMIIWLICVVWFICWVDSCLLGCIAGIDYQIWITFTAVCVYIIRASNKVDIEGKTVVITGCDSGIGLRVAKILHEFGFRVVAGCLLADKNGKGAEELRSIDSDRLYVIQLDVTKDEQIKKAYEEVKNFVPDGKLWGLLNNARVASLGYAEWLPVEETRKNLEVNVVGLINMTKTFLPLVRRAKGRIVNVASAVGRSSCPMFSTYAMTKHAVEGYTDSLRLEMKAWGVKVCIIEPGNYTSSTIFTAVECNSWREFLCKTISEEVKSDYGVNSIENFMHFMEGRRKTSRHEVNSVLHAMTEALIQKNPQARYMPQDFTSRFCVTLNTHFPEFIYDPLVMKVCKNIGYDFHK